MSKPVFLVVSILTEIIIGEPGVVAQQANSSPVKLQSDTNSLSRPSDSNSHPALCKPTREKQQETKCLGPCCRVEDTEAVPAWPHRWQLGHWRSEPADEGSPRSLSDADFSVFRKYILLGFSGFTYQKLKILLHLLTCTNVLSFLLIFHLPCFFLKDLSYNLLSKTTNIWLPITSF